MHRGAFLVLTCFLLSFVLATPSESQVDKLPEKYRVWLEEEVVYIITDTEKEVFLRLESEEGRESFIQAFWRKRDTNPSTPENEFREEHYKRLAYANEFLGRDTSIDGWRTDRGYYHILLGEPGTVQTFDSTDAIYPVELWFYNNPDLKRYGLPPFFYMLFWQRNGIGPYKLYSPGMDGPQSLITGYQTTSTPDWRDSIEAAHRQLYGIHPELAQASLSFLPQDGDTAQFQATAYGTDMIMQEIAEIPSKGVDTSYAVRFDEDRSLVESDYLFNFVPSHGMVNVLPGPGGVPFVHWVIEVDPQHIAMVFDDDREIFGSLFITSVEMVPRNEPDQLLLQVRKESFMSLTPAQAQTRLSLPFAWNGMTPVVPGSYDVRVIWRNRACPQRDESTCIKSYAVFQSSVEVPETASLGPQLSELVLAFGTDRSTDEPVYRPYRFGNLQILPNPRGVYAIGETLVGMVEPKDVEPGSQVRFRIVEEAAPESILAESSSATDELRLEPIVKEFTLDNVPGGRYRLVTDLLDAEGSVQHSRTADFTVTPRSVVPRPAVRGISSQIRPEVPGVVEMALGEQYLNIEETDKARELYETAVSKNSRLGPAIEQLAALLLEEGESGRVVELLEPVYANVQDRFEVLALLGSAYYQQKDYAKACELLERASSLRRPDVEMLNDLAMSYYYTGDLVRAQEILERSLSMDSEQPQVKELLEKVKSGATPQES